MSVLIEGMEKPKGCYECPFQGVSTNDVGYIGFCRITNKEIVDGDESWCPLVEVPTPHGRLIDADDFFKALREGFTHGTRTIKEMVEDIPTIIEAED